MRRRVLVLGAGQIAQRVHLPHLVAHPRVESVAVCDVDPSVAVTTAERWGVEVHRHDLEESSADLVLVCTPPHTHAALALQALRAGKDVIVEKPLATRGEDAREVRRTAERLGRTVQVCHTPAHRRDVTTAVGLVRDGRLGAVGDVDVSWTRSAGLPATVGGFSSGVVWDLGAHVTHLSLMLSGATPLAPGWRATATTHRPVVRAATTAEWYAPFDDPARGPSADDVVDAAFEGTAILREGTVLRVRAGWHGARGGDLVTARVRGELGELHVRTLFGFSPARERLRGPAVVLENTRTGRRTPQVRRQTRRPVEYSAQWDAFWSGADPVALDTAVGTVELCEGFERAAGSAREVVGA